MQSINMLLISRYLELYMETIYHQGLIVKNNLGVRIVSEITDGRNFKLLYTV